VRAPLEPRAGTVASFAFELVVRIAAFALLYAIAAVVASIMLVLASQFIKVAVIWAGGPRVHPFFSMIAGWVLLGALMLATALGAAAGVIVAIGSVLVASFSGMLIISLLASLALAMMVVLVDAFTFETALYFAAGAVLAGLLGTVMARSAGLLQPDRRLLQDFRRA